MLLLITGTGGLVGSETTLYFLNKGYRIHGIDNESRKKLFGSEADVSKIIEELQKNSLYTHHHIDIRNRYVIESLIKNLKPDSIIHCAAQPSHDKAASLPYVDFDINSVGTLNLLESFRNYCDNKNSIFINMSTNKVYGDKPNHLGITELETRYDFLSPWEYGIDESLTIDNCLHSLFGVSKLSADLYVQEYGKYFDLNTVTFRGGCITGPNHKSVELHGFLSYIIKCLFANKKYVIHGYKGKQVRDQIHAYDVATAFDEVIKNPKKGEVYNIGGQYKNASSILEIIEILHKKTGKKLEFEINNIPRKGDHKCYYTDMKKFTDHFPNWRMSYKLNDIIDEIINRNYT